ncbi:MAG: helical backbone metal receptor [Pseudonocardia sp.]
MPILIDDLGAVVSVPDEARRVVSLVPSLTEAVEVSAPGRKARWAEVPPVAATAIVPVWRRPWVLVGERTFAGDVLRRLGVANAYADHPDRYPRPPLDELKALLADRRADLVVLPSEPYLFTPDDGPVPLNGWEMYDDRLVIVGTVTATATLDQPGDVAAYQAMFDKLERLAVYDDDARAILAQVANRYRAL